MTFMENIYTLVSYILKYYKMIRLSYLSLNFWFPLIFPVLDLLCSPEDSLRVHLSRYPLRYLPITPVWTGGLPPSYLHELEYPSCEWWSRSNSAGVHFSTMFPPSYHERTLKSTQRMMEGIFPPRWGLQGDRQTSQTWPHFDSLLIEMINRYCGEKHHHYNVLPPNAGRHLLQRQTPSLLHGRREDWGGGDSVTSSVHIWAWSLHAAGNPLTGADEWGGGPRELPKCI